MHRPVHNLLPVVMLICSLFLANSAPRPARAETPPDFPSLTAATAEVAGRYIDLYYRLDFDGMEKLLADDVSFEDPTARLVFGSDLSDGKAAVMENFRTGYAGIKSMNFTPTRNFASGEFAVFEGEISWTFSNSAGKEITIRGMPIMQVIQVRGGQVCLHRDYGDYRVFMAQYTAQKDQ